MDNKEITGTEPPKTPDAPESKDFGGLQNCCVETIRKHALYNPMMVCADCKQIIKCFLDERSFRNYLTFCNSRRRTIQKGMVQGYHTIVFRSYDTYR